MPAKVQFELSTDCSEMQDGLQARIHDPLWFLARQRQFGEFQGDDAGSPAAAQLEVRSAPITRCYFGPVPGDPADMKTGAVDYLHQNVPLETLVEREPARASSQHNYRHAAEAGLHLLRLLESQSVGIHGKLFQNASMLNAPNETERQALDGDTLRFLGVMAGRVCDGLQLHAKLAPLSQEGRLSDLFNEPPFDGIPVGDRPPVIQAMTAWLAWYDTLFSQNGENTSWLRDRLEYAFAVSGQTSDGEMVMSAPEYFGGHLDWSSFVVNPKLSLGAQGDVASTTSSFLPTPVSFKGMPSPRLWELEDANVNFGKIEADPQDLARLLLVEFALVFGNDWFVVPVEVEVGTLCQIGSLIVTNTFGERLLVSHSLKVDGSQSPWRMFGLSPDPRLATTNGQDSEAATKFQDIFFLPPVLGVTLEGKLLEEVLLLRDEMANLAWAVERIVESPANSPLDRFEAYQETRRREEQASGSNSAPVPTPTTPPAYRLGTSVPDYWIPLLPVRDGTAIRLKRGQLPQTGPGSPEGTIAPQGLILDPAHDLLLPDEEVPREGARVTRCFQFTRWIDGGTHLWIGRRKQPGRGEGSSGLRFDIVEP